MKSFVLAVVLAAALPLHAQTSATLWVPTQQNRGDGGTIPSTRDLHTSFDSGRGLGASLSHRFGRLSGELGLFRTSSAGSIRERGSWIASLGDLDLTSITAMFRVHLLGDGPLDVYAGAGAARSTFGDLDSDNIREQGFGPVEIDSRTTAVVGAGVAYDLSPRWAIAADARWMPLEIRGEVAGQRVTAEIDPLLISAGLRVNF